MISKRNVATLALMALFAAAAACAENGLPGNFDATTTVTASAQAGQPTPTSTSSKGGTPTATSTSATPTAQPSPTATRVPVLIDTSAFTDVKLGASGHGTLGAMDGLQFGEFESQTTFMGDFQAPTDVTQPEIDFTLNLP